MFKQNAIKMMKLILKRCGWLILLLMVFGSGIYSGYWLSYKEDFRFIGAADHHLRDKIFFSALDGYISLSNRYLVNVQKGGEISLYHAFDKHYKLPLMPLLPQIVIGRYKGDKETTEWVNKIDSTGKVKVTLISDELIDHDVRRINVHYLFKNKDRPIELIYLIKDKYQVNIIGYDALEFSKVLMDSYKPNPAEWNTKAES